MIFKLDYSDFPPINLVEKVSKQHNLKLKIITCQNINPVDNSSLSNCHSKTVYFKISSKNFQNFQKC